jgi:hypothetical protein
MRDSRIDVIRSGDSYAGIRRVPTSSLTRCSSVEGLYRIFIVGGVFGGATLRESAGKAAMGGNEKTP